MAIRTEVTKLWTVGRFIVINSIRTNSKDGNGRTNSKNGNGQTNSKDGNGRTNLKDGNGRTNSKDGNGRTNLKDGNGRTNSKDGNGGIVLRLSDFAKALCFSSGTGYVDQILAVGLATGMN